MMSLKEISKALKGQRLVVVAADTGLSYPTIQKLAKGDIENYALDTVRRVSDYLLSTKRK